MDWLRFALSANAEQLRWAANPDIDAWLRASRLHPDLAPPKPDDPAERAVVEQAATAMAKAENAKLDELLHTRRSLPPPGPHHPTRREAATG